MAEICPISGNKEKINSVDCALSISNLNRSGSFKKNYTLNNFLTILFQINEKQFNNTMRNILKHYKLRNPEADLLENEFRYSHVEHKFSVLHKLTNIINTTYKEENDEIMLSLVEFSNYVLQHILRKNLENVGGILLQLTEWQQQSLKEKILRQQSKIAVNIIERRICHILYLCYNKIYYSDYFTDWLIAILNSKAYNVKIFFESMSEFLNMNVHKVKTNNNFRRRAKEFVKVNPERQRDVIDFLEEVIIKRNKTFDIVPSFYKKYAILLSELSHLVDRNYDLNSDNVNILKKIDSDFIQWTKRGDLELNKIITMTSENMLINIRMWPLRIQSRIDFIWMKIIL